MASRHLSARARQPGHDRTFVASEQRVASACRALLGGQFVVVEQPRDLADLYGPNPDSGRPLGVVPELLVRSRATGNVLFVEVKTQGSAGNAEERAAKHYTAPFIAAVAARTGMAYHPFVTVFCGRLAVDGRYVTKLPFLVPDGHRLLWRDHDRRLFDDFFSGWADRLDSPAR